MHIYIYYEFEWIKVCIFWQKLHPNKVTFWFCQISSNSIQTATKRNVIKWVSFNLIKVLSSNSALDAQPG